MISYVRQVAVRAPVREMIKPDLKIGAISHKFSRIVPGFTDNNVASISGKTGGEFSF